MIGDWGAAMGWAIGWAFGGVVLAAGALAWWLRRRSSPQNASFDTPSLPGSDWHEIAARYHRSRVEALRGWLGEDHELVRDTHPETPGTDPGQADDARPQRSAPSTVTRVDIPLPMRHDRPL